MTVRFSYYRLTFMVFVFLLSGTVLGIDGHLASQFLPDLRRDFTIFALVVPALTIFVFMLTLQWAVPWIELVTLFILAALWCAMGSWATDIITGVQCDSLGSQRLATRLGTMSAKSYCYEMKVIQAFSWLIFILFIISVLILIALVNQAQRLGRYMIWSEPIRELGWFGEWPGYYNTPGGMQMQGQGQGQYPMMYSPSYAVPQSMPGQPGQSIIIQPSANGGPPMVQTVPLGTMPGAMGMNR